MTKDKRNRQQIPDPADTGLTEAEHRYRQAMLDLRSAEAKGKLAVQALGPELGDPAFDDRLHRTFQEHDKEWETAAAKAVKAHAECRQNLRKKMLDDGTGIGFRPTPSDQGPFFASPDSVGMLVGDPPVVFLALWANDPGLFDPAERIEDEEAECRFRVEGAGMATWPNPLTITARWGIEITDELLTDLAALVLDCTGEAWGLVLRMPGSANVWIGVGSHLRIWRQPGLSLAEVRGLHQDYVHRRISSDEMAAAFPRRGDYWYRQYESYEGNSGGGVDEWVVRAHLRSTISAPGPASGVIVNEYDEGVPVPPGFMLQPGDIVVSEVVFGAALQGSYVDFRDAGGLDMRASPIQLYKWR